jgi:hypothetical protein
MTDRDHQADALALARQFVSQQWPLTDSQARTLTRILCDARAAAAYRPASRQPENYIEVPGQNGRNWRVIVPDGP